MRQLGLRGAGGSAVWRALLPNELRQTSLVAWASGDQGPQAASASMLETISGQTQASQNTALKTDLAAASSLPSLGRTSATGTVRTSKSKARQSERCRRTKTECTMHSSCCESAIATSCWASSMQRRCAAPWGRLLLREDPRWMRSGNHGGGSSPRRSGRGRGRQECRAAGPAKIQASIAGIWHD